MSEAKHLCLTCKHASEEIPSEVLVDFPIEDRIEKMNIHDELVTIQAEMRKQYKHVHYCPQEKAIVVGGDSPAQMRKQCNKFAAARS